jgi:hypothetical protein
MPDDLLGDIEGELRGRWKKCRQRSRRRTAFKRDSQNGRCVRNQQY